VSESPQVKCRGTLADMEIHGFYAHTLFRATHITNQKLNEVGRIDLRGSMPRNIAIALDSSACSVEALDWCLRNFLDPTDTVFLVHVRDWRPIDLPETKDRPHLKGFGYASVSDLNKDLDKIKAQKAMELLKEFAKQALKYGIDTDTVLLTGKVKCELCDFAEKEKIDIVIVGSRGLSMTQKLFVGSVSDYLAHNLHCSVMVVKTGKACT